MTRTTDLVLTMEPPMVKKLESLIILLLAAAASGCMGKSAESTFMYKNLSVADGSATAGEGHSVLFKGSPLMLSGNGIKVGTRKAKARCGSSAWCRRWTPRSVNSKCTI
jgi:hypothetical protein